jgi:hypothetical protein
MADRPGGALTTDAPLSAIYANTRPGLAGVSTSETLDLLADLDGTWIGTGFNLVALPVFPHEGVTPFRLLLSTTVELLEFTPIGAAVPNRGFEQPDIEIHGLRYLQRVADGVTNEPLHIEPGFWLNVPQSDASSGFDEIVRQSTIPHGNSVLARGYATQADGGPSIPTASSAPISHAGHPVVSKHYLQPYVNAVADDFEQTRPEAFKAAYVGDPSRALTDVLEAQQSRSQTVVHTVTLDVSTSPRVSPGEHSAGGGAIGNIPSDVDATSLESTFWIERVRELRGGNVDGREFLQLQYVQTVVLDFDNILWPHISVATLTKQ